MGETHVSVCAAFFDDPIASPFNSVLSVTPKSTEKSASKRDTSMYASELEYVIT
jgi:hypothetical protein